MPQKGGVYQPSTTFTTVILYWSDGGAVTPKSFPVQYRIHYRPTKKKEPNQQERSLPHPHTYYMPLNSAGACGAHPAIENKGGHADETHKSGSKRQTEWFYAVTSLEVPIYVACMPASLYCNINT